ncbi:MAG: fumarate hydratase [Candidatus Tantalella remota]|nr:fumarate hydratase [Candidatus Tantalella remota]
MNTRLIKALDIQKLVEYLCVRANTVLRRDVLEGIQKAYDGEADGSVSKKMLKVLLENTETAEKEKLPLCQDTGMAAVFIELGSEVQVSDGDIIDAVNAGIEKGYAEANLRKSIVADPVKRDNTGTNTPGVVHVDIVKGDKISITVMPKGFGSENKSRMVMLNPTSTDEDIIEFCVDTVRKAGPDACPPYILGVGIGGTMEQCTLMAKKALLRTIDSSNPKSHMADIEAKIKKRSNELKIGVMGLGGSDTVIGVNIMETATHIAGMPVAVNVACHALRSASGTL